MSRFILNNYDWVSKVQDLFESLTEQNAVIVADQLMLECECDHEIKFKILAKEFIYSSIAQPQNVDCIVAVLSYIFENYAKDFDIDFKEILVSQVKTALNQAKYFGNLINIHYFLKQCLVLGIFQKSDLKEDLFDVSNITFTFPPDSIEFIIKNDNTDRLIEYLEEGLIQKDYKSQKKCFELLHVEQHNPNLLQLAALYGSINCYNYLKSINVPSEHVNDYAIAGSNKDILNYCVKLENFLYVAVITRKFESLKFIIQNFMNPIDPNYPILDKAFMYACIEGHYRMINELYNNNARTFFVENHLNAIYGSILRSHVDIVEFLSKIPQTPINEIVNGQTPILAAVENNEIEIVRILSTREDINYHLMLKGKTPLYIAAEKNYKEIVSILSKTKNIDLNEGDNKGDTPLSVAIRNGYHDIVEELAMIENTEINRKDQNGETPLFVAISTKKSDIAMTLLSFEDIDVSALTNFGESCFLASCLTGNFEIMEIIFQRNPQLITVSDNNNMTPLIAASISGNEKIVKFLLEKVTNVNGCDIQNQNALYHACENGYLEIAKMLIEKGCQKNIISLNNYNCFTIAVCRGHCDIVELLINDNDIDKTVKDWTGRNILCLAASNNQPKILSLLLEKLDIDVNEKDNSGDTSLLAASHLGYFDIMEILIKNDKTDINIKNKKGQTAFVLAARIPNTQFMDLFFSNSKFVLDEEQKNLAAIECAKYGNLQNLKYLREKGFEFNGDVFGEAILGGNQETIEFLSNYCKDFSPHIDHFLKSIETENFELFELLSKISTYCFTRKTSNGDMLLHKCAEKGLNNFIETILNDDKVDINAQNNNGQTAFLLACRNDQLSTVEFLSNYDSIDMELPDKGKRTPLFMAASYGNSGIVLFLIEAGVNVNTYSVYGETPLYAACSRGFAAVVRSLIAIDYVDVNAVAENGNTPLFTATINNHENVVSLLLTREDINPNIPDKTGETPLQNAIANKFTNIAKMIANKLGVELPKEECHCHDECEHHHNHDHCMCGHCH